MRSKILNQFKYQNTAGVIADTTVSLTGIILGICSRYVKDDLTKKK